MNPHHRSLERLLDPACPWGLHSILALNFPFELADGGKVDIVRNDTTSDSHGEPLPVVRVAGADALFTDRHGEAVVTALSDDERRAVRRYLTVELEFQLFPDGGHAGPKWQIQVDIPDIGRDGTAQRGPLLAPRAFIGLVPGEHCFRLRAPQEAEPTPAAYRVEFVPVLGSGFRIGIFDTGDGLERSIAPLGQRAVPLEAVLAAIDDNPDPRALLAVLDDRPPDDESWARPWSSAEELENVSHYAALGVRRDADPAAIRQMFRGLAAVYLPGLYDGDPVDTAIYGKLCESFDVLSAPGNRAAYDNTLSPTEPPDDLVWNPGLAALDARVAGWEPVTADQLMWSGLAVPTARIAARLAGWRGRVQPGTRFGTPLEWARHWAECDPETQSWTEGAHDRYGLAGRRFLLAGHHLARAVDAGLRRARAAVARAEARSGRPSDERAVARTVKAQLTAAFDRCLAPQGGAATAAPAAASLFVPLDDTNVLSRFQSVRTVSRIPAGLPANRASEVLRDLHPSVLGVLCPVETPESEDVGLVRFLAMGADIDGDGTIPEAPAAQSSLETLGASASLMPFLNHNDAVRSVIGAKNLKQFVPVEGAEAPLVRTGAEGSLGAGLAEVVTADSDYEDVRVSPADPNVLECRPAGTNEPIVVELRPGGHKPAHQTDDRLTAVPAKGVGAGEIIAHSPGIVLEDGRPVLAPGVNCLVALMPYYGFNTEDAIVVSSGMAEKFASFHLLELFEQLAPGESDTIETLKLLARKGIRAGDALFEVEAPGNPGASLRTVRSPWDGDVVDMNWTLGETGHQIARILMRVRHPLQIGDKMTGRHGNKGVVGLILPDKRMPRLPDGRCVDMVLNPLGALRRGTLGQFLELHWGLVAQHRGRPVEATPFGHDGRLDDLHSALRDLADAGIDERGKATLTVWNPFSLEENTVPDVVVGVEYMVKLNHLARTKVQAQASARDAERTGQPWRGRTFIGGRRTGRPQRLGEMEFWALQAYGADEVIADALQFRRKRRKLNDSTQDRTQFAGLAGSLWSAFDVLRSCGFEIDLSPSSGAPMVSGADTDALADVLLDEGASIRLELCGAPCVRGPADDLRLDPPTAQEELRRMSAGDPPHPRGLLSPAVWGGDSEPRCDCADPQPEATLGMICDACRITIRRTQSPEYRHRVAYLELALAVPHPWSRECPESPDPRHVMAMEDAADGDSILSRGAEEGLSGFMSYLPVMPPGLRNRFLDADLGEHVPRLERRYQRIVDENSKLRDVVAALPRDGQALSIEHRETLEVRYRSLVLAVRALFGPSNGDSEEDTLSHMLRHKEGLLRHFLLGSSLKFTARAVLAPDPRLGIEDVGLPQTIWDELIPRGLQEQELTAGPVVILNRQPSLHRMNLLALRAVRHDDAAVRAVTVHPAILKNIAGDFDGDEVTLHRPRSPEAREQAWDLMRPARNSHSPANGNVQFYDEQELLVGASATGCGASIPKCAEAVREAAIGDDGAALDEATAQLHDAYTGLFEWGTGAASVSVFDLADTQSAWVDDSDPGQPAVASARIAGVKEATLGRMLDEVGQVHGYATRARLDDGVHVAGNYMDGLPVEDYLAATREAVFSLGEKKLRTPDGGALTKMLAEALYEVRVTQPACGTTRRIPVAALSGRSRGRRTSGTGDVEVRSPLTCSDPAGVCAACYGPDVATLRRLTAGASAGLLAAESIGERGTQLALKAIHLDTKQAELATISRILGGGRVYDTGGTRVDTHALWCDPDGGGWITLATMLRNLYALGGDPDNPAVDDIHFEILVATLGRILEASEEERRSPIKLAVENQPPLAQATTRGTLGPLLAAAEQPGGTEWALWHAKERLAGGWTVRTRGTPL